MKTWTKVLLLGALCVMGVTALIACGQSTPGKLYQQRAKGAAVAAAPPPAMGLVAEEAQFRRQTQPFNTEAYGHIVENPFLPAASNPLSTFAVDVDTASYANVRRFLTEGTMPPKDAVRIEELVNYFNYAYPEPAGGAPFSVNIETGGCPWAPNHRLVRIGLKGRSIAQQNRPASNLVFLLDVSGSMDDAQQASSCSNGP